MLAGFTVLALWLAPPQLERARSAEQSGDYAAMLREARAAATECRQASDTACEAEAANLSASAHYYRGEYDPAREAYQKALDLYRRAGDLKHQAYCLNNLGGVDFVQGRYLESMRSYDRADSLKAGPAAEEMTLLNRGALYQRLGRDRAALAIYQDLKRRRNSFTPSEQAQLLTNLGALIRRLGDPVKARSIYEQALRLYRDERNSDREIGTLKNLGILEALEFQDYVAARRRFGEALRRATATGSIREELQSRLYLAECDLRTARPRDAEMGWRAVRDLAQKINAPEEEWKADYGLGRLALERNLPGQARHHFSRAVEVIENIRTSLGRTILRRDFLAGKREVYDAMIALILAQPEPDLDALLNWMERARARALQETLSPEPVTVARLQQRLEEATALAVLWKRPGTNEAATLWITRHSAQVNGSAPAGRVIAVPDGAPQIADRAAWYIPTVRYLFRARAQPRWLWPWEPRVVAVVAGGGQSAATVLPGDEHLMSLPGARREVESIARQLNTRVVSEPSHLPAPLPVLHFAAHAIADTEDPSRSRIILPTRYLFTSDIARLDLTAVSLVTLSACETEAGLDLAGEGPQSLARAFLAAGAAATVASLWKVEDEATAEFMRIFYAGLARGEGKAQALAGAKQAMRSSPTRFSDPRHWAAFVLTGDGQTPLPGQLGWPALLSAIAAMLGAAALVHGLMARRPRG
ncbi:MAG: CHAT domain-containing protein [Bryobacterales bacterium]|nr:CHAT domain-containing protein [Bryobacterales bacterium]